MLVSSAGQPVWSHHVPACSASQSLGSICGSAHAAPPLSVVRALFHVRLAPAFRPCSAILLGMEGGPPGILQARLFGVGGARMHIGYDATPVWGACVACALSWVHQCRVTCAGGCTSLRDIPCNCVDLRQSLIGRRCAAGGTIPRLSTRLLLSTWNDPTSPPSRLPCIRRRCATNGLPLST